MIHSDITVNKKVRINCTKQKINQREILGLDNLLADDMKTGHHPVAGQQKHV